MTRKEDDQGPCANFKTLNTDFDSPSMERKSFTNQAVYLKRVLAITFLRLWGEEGIDCK